MSGPQRIRLSRAKGWRLPAGAVVVSRPTPWGNPFVVGRDGTSEQCVYLYRNLIAGYVCLTCKTDLASQREAMKFAYTHLGELRGKSLACWCNLDKPCHADVLLELANR